MYADFEKPKFTSFRLTATFPRNYKGPVIKGGQIQTAVGRSGTIVLQEILEPEFNIYLQVCNFLRPQQMPVQQQKAFLVSFLALKNSIQYFIKGIGSFQLRQGQFALLHAAEQVTEMQFEKAGNFQSLEIIWSEGMVRQCLPFFPLLQPLFSNRDLKGSFYLHPPGHAAGAHALSLAGDILHSPYNERRSLLYFENKVREYLLTLLEEAERVPAFSTALLEEEYEYFTTLAERLCQHPEEKFPIAELAIEAQMNELKLKRVFKEIFGMGIFEYQLAARMKEAHRLLEGTHLTTKEIASIVGYELTTSFITKFREFFGYPPSDVARKK